MSHYHHPSSSPSLSIIMIHFPPIIIIMSSIIIIIISIHHDLSWTIIHHHHHHNPSSSMMIIINRHSLPSIIVHHNPSSSWQSIIIIHHHKVLSYNRLQLRSNYIFHHLQQLYDIFCKYSLEYFSGKLPSSIIMHHFLIQIYTVYSDISVHRSYHTLLHLIFVSSLFTNNMLAYFHVKSNLNKTFTTWCQEHLYSLYWN